MTDFDRLEFLKALDRSSLKLTDWEVDFIESVMKRGQKSFSGKQRASIDRMVDHYERALSPRARRVQ